MQLTLRIDGITTSDADTVENLELLCLSNERYGSVELCFKSDCIGGMNLGFARIKLYNSNLAIDADATFESAKFLGEEICRRWNLQNVKIGEATQYYQMPCPYGFDSIEDNPLFQSFMKSSTNRRIRE
ncbi:MAG: hypothetical protein PHI47_06355 [Sulfuricurvum sp.]|uniref:hypothetical protein n=1 Tax=Sulfuricurvum sp. TaxID=2025608 RepID=UPI002619646D|nr:hypothetical protein [Sulfuricurvum sp.]MDD5159655.1 hypothetical protein [Sulfuricurvum sp.]